jgi:hypothetical protein
MSRSANVSAVVGRVAHVGPVSASPSFWTMAAAQRQKCNYWHIDHLEYGMARLSGDLSAAIEYKAICRLRVKHTKE